ncbi:MAG: S9 family peptidase [Acidimicrobiales bacterium]
MTVDVRNEIRAICGGYGAAVLASDIDRLVSAGDPQISPDGRLIAFVVSHVDGPGNTYRSRIWLVPADGSRPPRPLTAGDERDTGPRWSPDGSTLAFTSARGRADDGDRRSSLHLLPVDGPGETVCLVEGAEAFTDLAFSPDGTRLAYVTRTRRPDHHDDPGRRPPHRITSAFFQLDGEGIVVDRPRHTYVVSTTGAPRPRNLTPGTVEATSPAWTPDGRHLVVVAENHSLDLANELWLLDTTPSERPEPSERNDAGRDQGDRADQGGDVAASRRILTPRTCLVAFPTVSPDGRHVAVVGHDNPDVLPQNAHVGVIALDVDDPSPAPISPRWITTAIDRNWVPMDAMRAPQWLDERRLLAGLEDRGDVHLYEVALDADPARRIDGRRCITGWSAADTTVAFTATTAERPAELFVTGDHEAFAGERRLSHVTEEFLTAVPPCRVERFTAPSGDVEVEVEVEVDAWVVYPPGLDPATADARSWPMLLNIHGGPFTQYGERFFDEAQIQARAGYVVVLSNPRGGSGRDTAWGQAINGPKHRVPGTGWGSVDADDCMAVVDEALRRFGFVDPDRVGVLGGSYGGYMTTWLTTHTDRFAAGCSERSANNLLALEQTSDCGGSFHSLVGVGHLDDPAEYLRMSPITHVADLACPLLIVHSAGDLRCPVTQADELFLAATMLGKDVEYVRFDGESHELSRSGTPVHRRQRAEIILEFFDRHLSRTP